MSFGIRGAGLEDDDWSDESEDEDEDEEADAGEGSNEQTGLIRK
jgi:hypothetical protein